MYFINPPDSRRELSSNAAWAIGDQAVVSIGNYFTVILVARYLLDVKQVGAFNMILEVLLFLNSLQQGMVIYPLLVHGPALDRRALQRLAAGCLILTCILCVPMSAALLSASCYFAGTSLLLWAPLALVFQQLQETMRRTLIAQLRFADAIPGDAISYPVQAVILAVIGRGLTLPKIFAVMAITSALAAALQAMQVGPRRFPLSELKALARDFWKLGRWIVYSNISSFVTNFSYHCVLLFSWGMAPVGYFGAMAYLAKPVNPLMTALSGLIIPSVSRARRNAGTRPALHVGIKYALLGLAALSVYFGVLALFPSACLALAYGKHHPDYVQKLPNLLRLLVADWTLLFLSTMTLAILNGLGYSKANFSVTLVKATFTLLVALPLVVKLGLKGTMIGGVFSTAMATATAVYLFIRHYRDAPLGNESKEPRRREDAKRDAKENA